MSILFLLNHQAERAIATGYDVGSKACIAVKQGKHTAMGLRRLDREDAGILAWVRSKELKIEIELVEVSWLKFAYLYFIQAKDPERTFRIWFNHRLSCGECDPITSRAPCRISVFVTHAASSV
jgi:hypothetical protein